MRPEPIVNPREIPFVRLLLPLVAGILLSFWVNFPSSYISGFGLLCFLGMLILVFRKVDFAWRWVFGVCVAGWVMSLGCLLSLQHDDLNQPDHFSHSLENKNTLIAKVTVRDSTGQMKTASGNLLAYLEPDSTDTQLAYGDVLIMKGWLQPVPPPMNPHQFDYQRYHLSKKKIGSIRKRIKAIWC